MTGDMGWRRFLALLIGLSPQAVWRQWQPADEVYPAPAKMTKADRPLSDLLEFVTNMGA